MCHVILDDLIQLKQETVIDVMRCSRGKQTVQELQLFICKHTCSPDDDCTSRVCSLKIYLPGIEPRVPGHQSSTTGVRRTIKLTLSIYCTGGIPSSHVAGSHLVCAGNPEVTIQCLPAFHFPLCLPVFWGFFFAE